MNTPKFLLDPKKVQFLKTGLLTAGFLAVTAGGYFFFGGSGGSLFQASLIGGGTPKAFDGTVYPLQKTANWVKLSSSEYTNFKSGAFTYEEAQKAGKLIDIPVYDANQLKNDPAKLSWKGTDIDIRNALLTYVTAYGGAYTSGSAAAIEMVGSHPAVDIRAPKGTPVFAIANGKVTKVKSDKSDGTQAVIEHADVPSVENPSVKATYYSNYLHLDTMSVVEGQVVAKGDQIGTVGNTGIATTYHLHFQIDKKEAPFHPYWPFTFAEAKTAGLDFMSGVDSGLNKDRVAQYTINPFTWIKANSAFTGSATTTSTTTTTAPVSTNTNVNTAAPINANTNKAPASTTSSGSKPLSETTTPATAGVAALGSLKLAVAESTVTAGNTTTLTLSAYDTAEKLMDTFAPTTPVMLTLSSGAKGTLSQTTLTTFTKGTATFTYQTKDIERVQVVAVSGSVSVSAEINVTDRIKNPVKFAVNYPSVAKVGEVVNVTVSAMDENNVPTIAGLTDAIIVGSEGGEGTFSKTILSFQDFKDGIATVTFTPKNAGTYTISAVAGTVTGNGPVLTVAGAEQTGVFSDVSEATTHGRAISYLKQKGIIEGYKDGTFRPENAINRAEGTKVILASLGTTPSASVASTSFTDTQPTDWFSGWVELGKTLGVVAGNPDGTFTPSRQVNLAEALKIILLANKIDLTNETVFEKPYNDVEVDAWFALYFQYAKKKNLLDADSSGNVSAGKNLSRGEVAEIMYRLLRTQEANAESYSTALDN